MVGEHLQLPVHVRPIQPEPLGVCQEVLQRGTGDLFRALERLPGKAAKREALLASVGVEEATEEEAEPPPPRSQSRS